MFAIATTDLRWHAQLLERPVDGPVNFWTPTPWNVRLAAGSRWFFMLKAPVRKLGGFGVLSRYEDMPASEAWSRFGAANGVESEAELRGRVRAYAAKNAKAQPAGDPVIGCVLLEDCIFLPEALQAVPETLGAAFPTQIVKWKSFPGELALPYETEFPDDQAPFTLIAPSEGKIELRAAKKRVGQQAFRNKVLDAYGETCAFTGTRCRTALEAAHIQCFISLASNHVQNGLALRRDIHALFDAGLLSVTPQGRVAVSDALAGTEYAQLKGQPLRGPLRSGDAPSPTALAVHFATVFRAAHHS